MDYTFKTVRYEICELTGKKIGKETVKNFYYNIEDSKFRIIILITK